MTTSAQTIELVLSCVGTGCWAVCFWWMHRISERQNAVLKELKEHSERIEHLSREEHELIKEVHPAVGKIKESVAEIADSTNGLKEAPTLAAQPV
jgi:hypothetical protein